MAYGRVCQAANSLVKTLRRWQRLTCFFFLFSARQEGYVWSMRKSRNWYCLFGCSLGLQDVPFVYAFLSLCWGISSEISSSKVKGPAQPICLPHAIPISKFNTWRGILDFRCLGNIGRFMAVHQVAVLEYWRFQIVGRPRISLILDWMTSPDFSCFMCIWKNSVAIATPCATLRVWLSRPRVDRALS